MSAVVQAAPRPGWKTAYDTQMGLWRWLRSPYGRQWLQEHFEITTSGYSGGLVETLGHVYEVEEQRVLGADPFYVSEGMCQLVQAAAQTFQPEPLYPTDLLTTSGFVYFDRPFLVLDRFDDPATIAGFSWLPMVGAGDARTARSAREEVVASLPEEGLTLEWLASREGKVDGLALTIYACVDDRWSARAPRPPIVPFHLTPWWFGMPFEGNEVDEQGKPTGAGWWWKIAQTTLRLMQQQISARHPERPDRSQRRSAGRYGFPDREVVVVRLRREQAEPQEPSGESAHYSHRFIVGGHWRNQWYPASQVHRQIWISPYVKGDESLPLVVRPRRAFVWSQ